MKVVIVEDHLMFREVLHRVCGELGLDVVGEAGDGDTAVDVVAKTKPGMVLLDLHLPNRDGFAVLEVIRKQAKAIKVAVLSSHCDEYTVFQAGKSAVQGFIDKNSNSIATLKLALGAIAKGGTWYSEAFRRIRDTQRGNPQFFDKMLTPRERTILALIGQPLGDAAIAQKLGISIETVEKHRHNLLRKVGVVSTTDLARYAREHGFTLTAQSGGDALLP